MGNLKNQKLNVYSATISHNDKVHVYRLRDTKDFELTKQPKKFLKRILKDVDNKHEIIDSMNRQKASGIMRSISLAVEPSGHLDVAREIMSSDNAEYRKQFANADFQVPKCETIDYRSSSETKSDISTMAVMLPAGGLAERLKLRNNSRVCLRASTISSESTLTCFLRWHNAICAAGTPFFIMTSKDVTDIVLQQVNAFFESESAVHSKIIIAEQHSGLSFTNKNGDLHHDEGIPLLKPMGHGDLHFLAAKTNFFSSCVAARTTSVAIFQDTSLPYLRHVPLLVNYMISHKLSLAFLGDCFKLGEKLGALVDKVSSNTRGIVNVEYNMLESVVASIPTDDEGFVSYPSNLNILCMSFLDYARIIETGTRLSMFCNPKYKDHTKTEFKSPTRLESMFQDIAHLFAAQNLPCGVLRCPKGQACQFLKNDFDTGISLLRQGTAPHTFFSMESTFFKTTRSILVSMGLNITICEYTATTFEDIDLDLGPAIWFDYAVFPTFEKIQHYVQQINSLTFASNRCGIIFNSTDTPPSNIKVDNYMLLTVNSDMTSIVFDFKPDLYKDMINFTIKSPSAIEAPEVMITDEVKEITEALVG